MFQRMNPRFTNVKVINMRTRISVEERDFMPEEKNEFECLLSMRDLGKYVGRWIAIVDDKVVSTGDAGKEVFREAKERHPGSIPLILKVPSSTVMLL